ncbi:MAG: META domain-containing protein [Anaerolineales bacterium]|nr:META domain-containing protein [Anaerolineales bacterium]
MNSLINRGGFLLLAIVIITLMLSACSGRKTLTDTMWELTSLNEEDALEETTVTAFFNEDGTLTGSSGCNQYSTTYVVDGDEINIAPAAVTLMACPEPIMEQETAYLMALTSATNFKIRGDTLRLSDDEGVLAEFQAIEPKTIEGSSWDVISYNNGKGGVVSVIIDTEITADFDEEGRISGSAGCNRYTGSYEVDDENITIPSDFGTTRMACDDPIMEQEQAYLEALSTAATYSIVLDQMEFRTEDGALAVMFRSAE